MNCPGPKPGESCPTSMQTPKGQRCRECRSEANRRKAREWAQRNKEYLRDRKRTYSKQSLTWAQEVAPVATIKTADKLISDAIKFCF
jgi:hypothetical protein